MTICMLFHVSGRVQGVWYRAATQEQARRLGITGHARNLPDGAVEVLACGTATALAELERWLWQGPARAQVVAVRKQPVTVQLPTDFSTG